MTTKRPFKSTESIRIFDAPEDFDLARSLAEAESVCVVTAFAHWSGWEMVRPWLLKSKANITLIAGLDFCQSEPRVLRDWIGKSFRNRETKAFLWSKSGITFHPKVFLVGTTKSNFALVGSGNLSAGGLNNNVECFSYVRKASAVSEIEVWIQELIANRRNCRALDKSDVKEYEARYKAAASAKKLLNKLANKAERVIEKRHEPTIENWSNAIREAKKFFKTARFRRQYDGRRHATGIIKQLLHHPKYNFSRDELSAFYGIPELGQLVHIWKYRVWEKRARLRTALVGLYDSTVPIATRIDDATSIRYFGINAVSKILASVDPKSYPVWNAPVRAALASFGYLAPWGGTTGTKYVAFMESMQEFRLQTNALDMLALDCFLFEVGYPLLPHV